MAFIKKKDFYHNNHQNRSVADKKFGVKLMIFINYASSAGWYPILLHYATFRLGTLILTGILLSRQGFPFVGLAVKLIWGHSQGK